MKDLFNYEKLNAIFSYIMYFLVTNFLFFISNITVLAFFVLFGVNDLSRNLPLFFISLIPFGASFTALLYTMGLLQRNKEISTIKDYFRSYKQNFIQSTLIWCIELIIIFILSINIIYSNTIPQGFIFKIFSTTILIILLLITPNIYILLSRFHFKTNDLVKAAVAIAFSKPGLTLSNAAIFLFGLILIDIKTSYTITFVASIIAYLLMYRNRNMLYSLMDKNIDEIN